MSELLATALYRIVEAKHGRFLANPQDMYMGRSILTYGEFSELEWALLDQILRPGMVVVEAGANMGCFTVPIAKKVGLEGFVYAFEPQLTVFQQLCANLALNDLMNVQALQAGCGAEPGLVSIVRPDIRRENNFGGYSLDLLKGDGPIKVRVERLDDVVSLPSLHLIKADVEGMEVAVLEGAAGLIARHQPLLYLEANEADAPALIEHVFSLDYEAWWHLPPLFNQDNHTGHAENIFGRISSKNILCAPRRRKMSVTAARAVTGPDDHPSRWGATG